LLQLRRLAATAAAGCNCSGWLQLRRLAATAAAGCNCSGWLQLRRLAASATHTSSWRATAETNLAVGVIARSAPTLVTRHDAFVERVASVMAIIARQACVTGFAVIHILQLRQRLRLPAATAAAGSASNFPEKKMRLPCSTVGRRWLELPHGT
jgi:hypothetical protein